MCKIAVQRHNHDPLAKYAMFDICYVNFHPTVLVLTQNFSQLVYLTFPKKTNFPFWCFSNLYLSQCQNYNNYQYLYIHWSYLITLSIQVLLSDIFPNSMTVSNYFWAIDRTTYLVKPTNKRVGIGWGDHIEERQVKGMSLARENTFVFIPILRMTILMLEQYRSRVNV